MSLQELAARLQQLESPFTTVETRHAADQWLTQFRGSTAAWAVVQQALSDHHNEPRLRAHAAQIFAWKCKHQMAQLTSDADRAALLEGATAVLAALPAADGNTGVAARALCVAIANLVIRCAALESPLQALGSQLAEDAMLAFLTVLPGECEDAYAAHQTPATTLDALASIEGLAIKQRAQAWCAEVGAWLVSVHTAALQAPDNLEALSQAGGNLEKAVRLSCGRALETSAAVARCFAAWVACGGLFNMEAPHWKHLLRTAGGLISGTISSSRTALDPVAAGVDVLSEAIERAPEAAIPVLLDIVLRLPAHVRSLKSNSDSLRPLIYLFSTFCATFSYLAASQTPAGAALRPGLLQLLGDIGIASETYDYDEEHPATSCVDALGEVMGAILNFESGIAAQHGPPLAGCELNHFVTEVVTVLLRQTTLPDAALVGGADMADGSLQLALRAQASWPLELAGEILRAERFTGHVLTILQQQLAGNEPLAALRAVDACLFAVRAAASIYSEGDTENDDTSVRPGQQQQWPGALLTLFAAAQASDPRHRGPSAPISAFHVDLLACFAAVGPALLRTLSCDAQHAQQQRGIVEVILSQAAASLACAPQHVQQHAQHGELEESEDVVVAAARALKALVFSQKGGESSAAAVVATVGSMLAMLTQRPASQGGSGTKAREELIAAAVHAAHAEDAQLATAAHAVLHNCTLGAFSAAASQAGGPVSTAAAAARLQTALGDVHAVLNELEARSAYVEQPGSGGASAAILLEAVTAILGAWPLLVQAVAAAATQHSTVVTSPLTLELASTMASCVHLAPSAVLPHLQPLLECACAAFFLPGGMAMHRVLCASMQTFFSDHPDQQLLLATAAGAVLTAAPAQPMFSLRGGDANPEAAIALLTLAAAAMRQCRAWQDPGNPAPALELIRAALQLATANVACNHKDTSQRAIDALSAALSLILDASCRLHAALLGASKEGLGALAMRGILLCLLCVASSARLPKIVNVVADVAAVAGACCGGQSEAATQLLGHWVLAARQELDAAGAMPGGGTDAALSTWDWGVAMPQVGGDAAALAAAKRSMARGVRRMIEAARSRAV